MTDLAASGSLPESVPGGNAAPAGPVVAGAHELTAEWLTGALATFVAKVPAASEASRMAARTVRTYEIEAAFSAQLAGGLTAHLPACYHVAHDPEPDHYVVLLEDLSPAEQGDQLGGSLNAEMAGQGPPNRTRCSGTGHGAVR
jgi:hypothetical protein